MDGSKRNVAVCGVAHLQISATHFVLQLNRILNEYFRLLERKKVILGMSRVNSCLFLSLYLNFKSFAEEYLDLSVSHIE